MLIRRINPGLESRRLSACGTSFSTDRVYRVAVDQMSVVIGEEKLTVPFQKTYPFDSVKKDVEESDFAVVVENGDAIAGFATVKHGEWNNRAVLTGIFVAPESRGKGIGRALLETAVNYAKTRSARCLFVETQNVNYPAIRFYRHAGFEFCGFDRALYDPAESGPGEIAFYFYKDLSS